VVVLQVLLAKAIVKVEVGLEIRVEVSEHRGVQLKIVVILVYSVM
jgi:hypothetical protein